jgi:hypothetical protein
MNQNFNNALTQETPGKVFALLGVAMFSMAFMLGVALSDASFEKQYAALPNPFALDNVVSSIDNAAYAYSGFLQDNLFSPLAVQMDVLKDNAGFVAENSGLTYALGFSEPAQNVGQVAGASIQKLQTYIPASEGDGVLDGLYRALIQ